MYYCIIISFASIFENILHHYPSINHSGRVRKTNIMKRKQYVLYNQSSGFKSFDR